MPEEYHGLFIFRYHERSQDDKTRMRDQQREMSPILSDGYPDCESTQQKKHYKPLVHSDILREKSEAKHGRTAES